jgi:hypothetical protein
MKKNNEMGRLKEEFREFSSLEGISVPKNLSENIFKKIRADLNPPATMVFLKVTFIHLFVGLATLAFCPQFGVSFTSSMGLMTYLMQYGEAVCMMGCGALFIGASLLAASLLLRPEEVKVIHRNRILQITSLASLSVIVLSMMSGDVAITLGLVWMLGAIVGGAASLQVGWTIRRFAVQGTL